MIAGIQEEGFKLLSLVWASGKDSERSEKKQKGVYLQYAVDCRAGNSTPMEKHCCERMDLFTLAGSWSKLGRELGERLARRWHDPGTVLRWVWQDCGFLRRHAAVWDSGEQDAQRARSGRMLSEALSLECTKNGYLS